MPVGVWVAQFLFPADGQEENCHWLAKTQLPELLSKAAG